MGGMNFPSLTGDSLPAGTWFSCNNSETQNQEDRFAFNNTRTLVAALIDVLRYPVLCRVRLLRIAAIEVVVEDFFPAGNGMKEASFTPNFSSVLAFS